MILGVLFCVVFCAETRNSSLVVSCCVYCCVPKPTVGVAISCDMCVVFVQKITIGVASSKELYYLSLDEV